MKKTTILLILITVSLACFAQTENNKKGESLSLAILVQDFPEKFPVTAQSNLMSKISTALTSNGIMSSDILSRFFISVVATPVTKDVIPGNPMQIAQTIEYTFYIADYNEQKVYSSLTIKSKGVGSNDEKSYINNLRSLNLNVKTFSDFVSKGKNKIINYYDTNAPFIIEKARQLSKQHKYEEAIFMLIDIPYECNNYSKYMEASNDIYQQFIDYQCNINLNKARTSWMSEQNLNGANAAAEYLAAIMPDANCYNDAMALYNEIKNKVLDDWKFEMKQYQDQTDLESQRIEAMRAVGIEYGKGQQPTTTNIGWLR